MSATRDDTTDDELAALARRWVEKAEDKRRTGQTLLELPEPDPNAWPMIYEARAYRRCAHELRDVLVARRYGGGGRE